MPVFGIESAGKSSLVARLRYDDRDPKAATIGFEPCTIRFRHHSTLTTSCWPRSTRYRLTLYDVGGGPKIRGIWKSYIAEAHALIYVVRGDSSADKLRESVNELKAIMEQSREITAKGKPILIFVNCIIGKPTVSAELRILLESEGLGPLSDKNTPAETLDTISIREVSCRGVFRPEKHKNQVAPLEPEKSRGIDPRVFASLNELIDLVERYRGPLEQRIAKDVKRQHELSAQELLAKRKRIEEYQKLKSAEMTEQTEQTEKKAEGP